MALVPREEANWIDEVSGCSGSEVAEASGAGCLCRAPFWPRSALCGHHGTIPRDFWFPVLALVTAFDSKAFGTVLHDLLRSKLGKCNLDGATISVCVKCWTDTPVRWSPLCP
ncbi:unnamed protein product [Lepidochelys olivacea]